MEQARALFFKFKGFLFDFNKVILLYVYINTDKIKMKIIMLLLEEQSY